ncbi:allophanate hydrolase [Paenibacillus sp. H1-7]|uniref:allophanate hydrolase n=1 Tax=Paenibacillus sp. H1-7 TaxID=2282849 RepID=UPI001EF97504|nr:allophanate hydrolase [Paenibacillus sp. H1-7]ULL16123.1 allophanate hydrolase [Paenibacillus sp. H1-7]
MKTKDAPGALSIGRLREQYLNGETTPEAVISDIIQRANEDVEMNLWITPPTMEWIRPYLDQLNAMDRTKAPLWGIPFAIKDNIDLAGLPTTAGCPDYSFIPEEHAAVVARLIEAGAIPVGKTNLDQFATGLVGTRSPYGETHNALRPELISGGSSSGSAVAVARGHAAFALGTDTAGSGRVPAALNRLVGYKPSLGAWPTKGVVPACASLDCVTVFARNLEDALVVDSVARGLEASDPWSRMVAGPAVKLPGKIILPKHALTFFGPFADEYRHAWNASVAQWESLGIPIEYAEIELFSKAAAILYEGPWVAERWAALGGFLDAHPGAANQVTELVLRSATSAEYDATAVFQAMHDLQVYKLEARKLLQDAVLVLPTSGGTWSREQVEQDPVATNRDMGRYTNHCNLLDLCAAAVPGEDAGEQLPFGITLFALAENEGLVCGAAERFMNRGTPIGHAEPNGLNQVSAAPDREPTTLVAVCGLHMRGFPLEKQMVECRAAFIREESTAPRYQFVKLPTVPAKPGLIKLPEGGSSIRLEVWEMPLASFGRFAASIPAPLGIGKVELADGSEVPGFVCEAYAAEGAEDITASGGWRQAEA